MTPPPEPTLFQPLANSTFRKLFLARVVALVGSGLTTVALAALALDFAGERSGAILGQILALKMGTYVLVAPLVGAVAHLLPRRATLIAMDLLRAGVVFCMPLVDSVGEVYALMVVLSAGSAVFTPTYQATLPDVLTDEALYTRALVLSRVAYELEAFLPPLLAALLLGLSGQDQSVLFDANALTFCASAVILGCARLPEGTGVPPTTGGPLAALSFGLRRYLSVPRLRALLLLCCASAAGVAAVIVNTLLYVCETLGGSKANASLVLSAPGLGSIVAALLLVRLLAACGERRALLAGGLLVAAGVGAACTGPGLLGLVLIWIVVGFGWSLVETPSGRLITRSGGPSERPALFAAHFALTHFGWGLAYPLAGWLGAACGLRAAFLTMGALSLACVVAAGLAWRRADRSSAQA